MNIIMGARTFGGSFVCAHTIQYTNTDTVQAEVPTSTSIQEYLSTLETTVGHTS